MPNSYFCTREDLEKDNGHLLVLFLREWYSISEDTSQGIWDLFAEKMLVEFAESGCPIFPCYDSIEQRSTQKKKTWKTVDSLCCHSSNNWNCFSNNCFCKPAQSLRSSRGDVWRVRIHPRENGATRCDGTIKFLTRAQCDQDRSSFGLRWPSVSRFSIATTWRANWEAVTTR